MSRLRRSAERAPSLGGAGDWVLPVGFGDSGRVALARLGTVDGSAIVTVDARGLVSLPSPRDDTPAWSLDWWVGADDRWHLASLEPGVRQRLVDGAPVVETAMRIPSGDAVHLAYAVRSPDGSFLVVEVSNRSPVPFALALVVRPLTPAGWSRVGDITIAETGGGVGRDVPQVVAIDGVPSLLLPRPPARAAQGDGHYDVADEVTTGGAPPDLPPPTGGPHATAAFLLPVTHSTTVKVLVPLDFATDSAPDFPTGLPPAANVVGGWAAHTRRGARTEVPDSRLAEGIGAGRAALLIIAATARLDATVPFSSSDELSAQADLVTALDREGFHDDAAEVLSRWPDRLLGPVPSCVDAAAGLAAIVEHWRLTRDDALARSLLPEIVALAKLGHSSRASRRRVPFTQLRSQRLSAFAELLAGIGQTDAAQRATQDADAESRTLSGAAAVPLGAPDGWAALRAQTDAASPAWAWPEGVAGNVRYLERVRAVLVEERPGELAVLPSGIGPWWGQGVELHDAPTAFGRLSFAVRWHGDRPALLWELIAHEGVGEVSVTVPVLDPSWRTAERRGDALLAAVPTSAILAGPTSPPPDPGRSEPYPSDPSQGSFS